MIMFKDSTIDILWSLELAQIYYLIELTTWCNWNKWKCQRNCVTLLNRVLLVQLWHCKNHGFLSGNKFMEFQELLMGISYWLLFAPISVVAASVLQRSIFGFNFEMCLALFILIL